MTSHAKPHHQPNDHDMPDDIVLVAWETQWQASLPRFTEGELLDTFPAAKAIMPQKMDELKQARAGLLLTIKQELAVIQQRSAPHNRWFWRQWIKWTDARQLRAVNAHLARLTRLQRVSSNVRPQYAIKDLHIQQARAVPLAGLIPTPLRKSGKTLVGRCPLHPDRSPSFHVYPATNSWYCYGCQQGGDAIAFIRYLHGLSFPAAVRYLIHEPAP